MTKPEPKLTKIKLPDGVDYLKLFYLIRQNFSNTYLFESLSIPKKQERYYTFGFDPKAIFYSQKNKLFVSKNFKISAIKTENPYQELKKYLPNLPKSSTYRGGLVGYFSYESANYFEPALDLPEHEDFPNFELGLYMDGLIYDSKTSELEYYTYAEDRSSLVVDLINKLAEVNLPKKLDYVKKVGHNIVREEYEKIVEDTLVEIRKGNTFQAEVGIRSDYEIKGDKFAAYLKLRDVNPSPYMFYVKFGAREVFGSSPELVVSSISGKVLTTPAAGTIGRGSSKAEDDLLSGKLLKDPKEIAEHAMLVDMHRNDISKVCKPGTVKINDLMHLMKFKFVQHIVSDITGELRDDKDSFDLLASIMPCGVLTGAPKVETMKIIARNEKTPRGPYGGAVGRFSLNGDCAFAMPIRSLFCSGDKCYTQACAGIVYDSMPPREYKEVIAKLAGLEQTIKDVTP
ncbi:anthranilate synthase component I family protein [Candidatus Saccharibacteria bacterium]|nr:anthranilate synthase component I family protein [Candidatus Saccharibacteria bacterium]